MLKICLISDNHGVMTSIKKILSDNPMCDYYFHLGDSNMTDKDLEPFISVQGNCDYFDFPKQRIIEIGNHRILLIHGNGYTWSMNIFVDKAKNEKVDTVFFGHTHIFMDDYYNGIRFINPGSIYNNRDLTSPCYAIVTIDDDNEIKVERINLYNS